MTESRVRWLLVCAILVMSTVPPIGAFYLLDHAVQTSLNLGFNERIEQGLEIGSDSLKALKRFDPGHEAQYRQRFEAIEALQRIYSQPEWLKAQILGPLRLYFGFGLGVLVLLAVVIASLLSRRIRSAYRHILSELLAQRERGRYLEQMASWQELARVLAHEIKNPLTPVEVMVSSLPRAYLEKSPEQFRRQLHETQEIVAEELSHLKLTVSRFSEFARLPEAILVDQPLWEAIEKHLLAIRASFPEADVKLRGRHEARIARVRLDAGLFRQVLMNIISNGVEANRGSTVYFDVHIAITSPGVVDLSIANDGAPIPKSLTARLFDPYVSERHSPENMGLGLAIVKKIVVQHQGGIAYSEQEGRPTFVITLPRVI